MGPKVASVGCAAYVQYGTEWRSSLGRGGEGHFGLSTVTLIIINAKLNSFLKRTLLGVERRPVDCSTLHFWEIQLDISEIS